ncbi:MAG: hypothetical protein OXG68_09715, partial [Chloroflexi bacterium]|nr:hypothetical protein [Chloroflexota bacterium]
LATGSEGSAPLGIHRCRRRDLGEDVAAMAMMVATIVVMVMVALLVRFRHRCRYSSVSKIAWRNSGQVAR